MLLTKTFKQLYGLILLGTASASIAAINTDLSAGSNKWGFSGEHSAMTQKWDGKPFVMETEIIFPDGKNPMPKESWFGLFAVDSKNGNRYIGAITNVEFNSTPEYITPVIFSYENHGNMQKSMDNSKKISYKTGSIRLRMVFDGKKIQLFYRLPKADFVLAGEKNVPAGFLPNNIGIVVDGYNDKCVVKNVKFNEFCVEGEGPAKSDKFLTQSDTEWQTIGKRAIYQRPETMKLSWMENTDTSDVFDLGSDAELGVDMFTTEFDHKNLLLEYACYDESGKLLKQGEKTYTVNFGHNNAKIFIPSTHLMRNGVYILTAEIKDGSRSPAKIKQQFAVIPPQKITPGLFDQKSPYSVNYFADWKLAARIGAKKVRQTYYNTNEFAKYVELARNYGMLLNGPYLNMGIKDEMPKSINRRAGEIAEMLIALKKKYPDLIYCQELYNEPENWPPTSTNTDLIPFAAMVNQVAGKIKQAGSPLQLMGTGTTHCNLSFLKKLAILGGENQVDIVAVHGYRSPNRPEFGHEDDIAAIRDLFGPDKPIYVNEDAYFAGNDQNPEVQASIIMPVSAMIESDELTHGIYIQRKFLCQLAAGYSLVNQFDSIKNHSLSTDRFHRRPGLVTYAALTSLMPHPVFKSRDTQMHDSLWAINWENDGVNIKTLWTLNDPETVVLSSAETMTVYDSYANPIASGKEVCLAVNGCPLFVKGGKATIKERRKWVKGESPAPSMHLPEEFPEVHHGLQVEFGGNAVNMKESQVWIVLRNVSGQPIKGIIAPKFMNNAPEYWTFSPAQVSFTLAAGEEKTITFAPSSNQGEIKFDPYNPVAGKGYAALWWADGFRLAAILEVAGSEKSIIYQHRPLCLRGIPYVENITIDAELSDWQNIPLFKQMGAQKRNVQLAKFWTGETDFSPSFRMAWDNQGLLFAAEVIDDKQDISQKGLNAWRTDSVQLGLSANHRHPSFTDFPVITLAASGPAILQRDTPSIKAGDLPQITLKTKRIEGNYGIQGKTIYECRIPWSLLKVNPDNGQVIGFAVQFNESDGWWRKGWEGYFTEMGGHLVDPRYFGDLTLIK